MRRLWFAWMVVVYLLAGCSPASQLSVEEAGRGWAYTDLRLIDPPDAPSPTLEIIAAYLKRARLPSRLPRLPVSLEWRIRLEMLEVSPAGGADLFLALDHAQGGSRWLPFAEPAVIEWDTLVYLPARGPAQAWNAARQPLPGLPLSLQRDSLSDTIEIRLPASALLPSRAGLRLLVVSAAPGSAVEADRTSPIFSEGQPPAPVQIWMVFWNSLPAYTPAQALRRWDGAHTGPYGGRHGLYNLLRTARARRIPLTLLDLKALPSLAALDYGAGLPLVQRMARQGLLLLPEVQPPIEGQPLPAALFGGLPGLSRQTGLDFGLPASQAVFLPAGGPAFTPAGLAALPAVKRYPILIAQSQGGGAESSGPELPLEVYAAGSRRILILGAPGGIQQAGPSGLSQEVIRTLASAAQTDRRQPMVARQPLIALGGDLTTSGWGDPASARLAFEGLAARPWVRFVSPGDLSRLPAATLPPPAAAQPAGATPLPAAATPAFGLLSQFFSSLYGPLSPAAHGLPALRAVYAAQAGILRFAAAWAGQPFPIQSCDQDLDGSGLAECVLASDSSLAVFDARSGGLSYLFSLESGDLHLLLAPTALVAAGLGDPAGWDPSRGLQADPQVIPGAFWTDDGTPGCPCQPEWSGDRLLFHGSGLERSYRLLPEGGLRVEISAASPLAWELPVLLDPWQRFTPAWGERYAGYWEGQDWVWGLQSGPRLRVRASQSFQVDSFTATQSRMGITEDPNQEYPAGHYLPFPLSLVRLPAAGEYWVEIRLDP